MGKGSGSVAERARQILEKPINGAGYDVWDVEYIKEGAEWHLVVTIDSPDGIDLNACEKVHMLIDPILDEYDPVPDSYNLDVSSPGIERNLRTKEHFSKCAGEKITVRLFKPLDGSKQHTGILLESDDPDYVNIENNGKITVIPFEYISKANVVFDF